jgi:Mn2+/Fe2+ NRAMP family transporter
MRIWAPVINGVLAPPVMVLLMLLVRKERVMGKLIVEGGSAGSRQPPWRFQSSEWGLASGLLSAKRNVRAKTFHLLRARLARRSRQTVQ